MIDDIIISAKGIKKSYIENSKEVFSLDIEKFDIYKGKINVLMGPNGSGKTTLLNILSLVDRECQGDIFYHGKLISNTQDLFRIRREFSVVWQDPYLYKGTVFYNIALPLKMRRIDKRSINKRVNEIAQKLEIHYLMNKRYDQISGGEKQKIALARSLISNPEVLFVDEPANNLDQSSELFYYSLIKVLIENKQTVFMITHNLEKIKEMVDYITVLEKGEVVKSYTIS